MKKNKISKKLTTPKAVEVQKPVTEYQLIKK